MRPLLEEAMEAGPYVRPRLSAARRGIPDAGAEVSCWLDHLEELLMVPVEELSPTLCYDLLASWARLERVSPLLLAECTGEELKSRADELLAQHGEDLARQALTLPCPTAWQEEAADLGSSYLELIDPLDRHARAARILADLDDAELTLYAARRHQLDDPHLAVELDDCRSWLIRNALLFLAASVSIQAVAMTIRPTLAEEDYELAQTALKYEALLDAAEEAEAELSFADVCPWPAQVVEAVFRRLEPMT